MYINDLSSYLKEKFGYKVYKLALNGGMSCPNRDGTKGIGGCIFCSQGGSGDFASDKGKSISEQIEEAKRLVGNKISNGRYIAYFQAYTTTYAPVDYLRKIFTEAINHPDIEILSVATRPDCLDTENIKLLAELNQMKPVWAELGLQTVNEESIRFIRRGYDNKVFEEAVKKLAYHGIEVIVHVIIGLPHESERDILNTIQYINCLEIQGVKLQQLHVLKGTDLEQYYYKHGFYIYSIEEYADILFKAIEHLQKEIVIHRLTGDGPKKLLIEPLWSGNKRMVMNYIRNEMSRRNIMQGAKAAGTGGLKCQ